MTKAKPSAVPVPLESWKVKSLAKDWAFTSVPHQALEASLARPSVRRSRVPLSVDFPFNARPVAVNPAPKLTPPEVAPVTVRVVLPAMPPEVAEMVELPTATAAATPDELMVAVAGVADAQVTEPVMFFVLLSE
jgi:hypothetical protein